MRDKKGENHCYYLKISVGHFQKLKIDKMQFFYWKGVEINRPFEQ